mmetsp:Transcript_60029/g.105065  ORF Transcript_60029/g.105065 Transcript_60029/m.105065 type:complete len:376 (-) Transcript_60029:149-1276(-)
MHIVVLLLVWLGFASHGFRVERRSRPTQACLYEGGCVPSPNSAALFQQLRANRQPGAPKPETGLANLLLASNPIAAWHGADAKKGSRSVVKSQSGKSLRADAAGLVRRGSSQLLLLRGGAGEDQYEEYMVPTGRTLREKVPTLSLAKVREVLATPILYYTQSPPITRSWVSAAALLAILTSQRIVDTRSICLDSRAMMNGEWWRVLTNFLFMGDKLKSIFFWMQLNHFWQCSKMLELIKFRWEPDQFLKLIVGNAGLLCIYKMLFPHNMFLGTPFVLAFFYTYAICNDLQPMNFLGVFMVRCSWLPMLQMIQDWIQTGDLTPNLLSFMSGHTYYYMKELRPRLLLPAKPRLADIRDLLLKGKPIVVGSEDGDAEE